MKKNDDFGDRMKAYEARGFSLSHVMPGEVMIARMDGRSFHTFTRGMERPFDAGMIEAMRRTTGALVKEFGATIGYTQSDEITLVWITKTRSQVIFGGRVQKILSSLAASATAEFIDFIDEHKPGFSKKGNRPRFDCRVFTVPSQVEAMNCLLWRQQDATKNAISMAAQSVYSPKQLHGKDGGMMQEMLFQKGINFNDYPYECKRGSFAKSVTTTRFLTEEELIKLPEHVREVQSKQEVIRSAIEFQDIYLRVERGDHDRWIRELFHKPEA